MSAPWLVLDTATPVATVAVVDIPGGGVRAEHVLSETKKHAEGLMDAIDRALLAAGVAFDEIVGVGVGRGPGSFIGVRTGIATAKGLVLGRAHSSRPLPLVGLPTLLAVARTVVASGTALPMGRGLAVIDAKRGELYAQLLKQPAAGEGAVRVVEPAAALSPGEVASWARGLAFVVGVGVQLEGSSSDGDAPLFFPCASPAGAGLASVLASIAASAGGVVDELESLAPDYCRAPDAKLPTIAPGARRGIVDLG